MERSVRTLLPTVPYPILNFQTLEEAEMWMKAGDEVSVQFKYLRHAVDLLRPTRVLRTYPL